MTADVLLAEAGRRGILLFHDGAGLGFDAPAGAMTPEFRAALVEHKGELMVLLASAPESDPCPPYVEPGWVEWAQGLPPDQWEAWRALADRYEAALPPGGSRGERLEAGLERAWRNLARPETEPPSAGRPARSED